MQNFLSGRHGGLLRRVENASYKPHCHYLCALWLHTKGLSTIDQVDEGVALTE